MLPNTKLLVIFSFLIIVVGSGLLWFGLKPQSVFQSTNPSTPIVDSTQVATLSAQENNLGVLVTKVVDGDTIKIESGETVRLIGLDTPETVDPRRPVGCFGKEASNKLKSLVEGKRVILEKDISDTDKYKRLLRYIYLPLGDNQLLFINDYLIREGFATALTYPPDVKYTNQFLEAQREAKNQSRGLWGSC